jgi:hypothetical protein
MPICTSPDMVMPCAGWGAGFGATGGPSVPQAARVTRAATDIIARIIGKTSGLSGQLVPIGPIFPVAPDPERDEEKWNPVFRPHHATMKKPGA